MDWLRNIWCTNKGASEERLIGVAEAAIRALRGAGKAAAVQLHAEAGRIGWAAEYDCECFDKVLDAVLKP